MIEIGKVLSGLAKQRPVFHSEADFQHAFAWEIHQGLPAALIRLELPVQVKHQFFHIDIWVAYQDTVLAFELKYKTRGLSVHVGGERYRLKDQSAQDIGRYDFVKDIQRLEQVATAYQSVIGYAILLTNDSAYWTTPANQNTVDAGFRLHDGRVLEGVLSWGANASEGTIKDREQPLELQGKYHLQWSGYSQPSPERYGEFRSLVVNVLPIKKAG
ncbi:MAG: hypothetical protein ONB30_04995 [candidate division KSB1 bacterium]|nr:hypothetical protein [candidate division KSB1 bacterium]